MSVTRAPLGWGDTTRVRWLPDAVQDESPQRFELIAVAPKRARWLLEDGEDESARERFKVVAANAAVALGYRRDSRAWIHWLEILLGRPEVDKNLMFDRRSRRVRERVHRLRQVLVEIPKVCEQSALYCDHLAEQAAAEEMGRTKAAPGGLLGNTLQSLRHECGWTIKKLAQGIGVHPKSVADHLHGETSPKPCNLESYAKVFSVELERTITAAELLNGRALKRK
jgi:DNA-binding XRE family transcriptional regulator